MSASIRCVECLQEHNIDDAETAVSWYLDHDCERPEGDE